MANSIKKIRLYNLISLWKIAKILKACGDDMYSKYGLKHWKNGYLKTILIVILCAIKNSLYAVFDNSGLMIATFQTRRMDDALHFSKLAVLPSSSSRGVGSYCIAEIETMAKSYGLSKLKCEVYDKSLYAYAFYEKRGFVRIGEMNTLKYSEFILEKRLSEE